jgi:hypothetical protein
MSTDAINTKRFKPHAKAQREKEKTGTVDTLSLGLPLVVSHKGNLRNLCNLRIFKLLGLASAMVSICVFA